MRNLSENSSIKALAAALEADLVALDRDVSLQLACQWIVGQPALIRRIARSAHAGAYQITGIAVAEVARLLLAGKDPADNIGAVVWACRHELNPRAGQIDTGDLAAAGAREDASIWDVPPNADDKDREARRKKARKEVQLPAWQRLGLLDAGQNHREGDHRQKAKRFAALEAGQLAFFGIDWKVPASNDDDDPDDPDGGYGEDEKEVA